MATLLLCCCGLVHADANFPSAPIELIVPFTPGGLTDTIARFFTRQMASQLGQTIEISNYPGRQAPAGLRRLMQARPDGHTLLVVTVPHVANAMLIPKSGYTGIDQLRGIAFVTAAPQVIVVSAGSPVRSLQDLTQAARTDTLQAGTAGTGSTAHLAAALFSDVVDTDLRPIAYPEGGGAIQALLKNEVDVVFANIQEILPPLRTGQLRALAVTDQKRHPLLPDVPTTAEAGMKDLLSESWTAVVAPKDTPEQALVFYSGALEQLFANPHTHQQATDMGLTIRLVGHQDFEKHMQEEVQKLQELIHKHHITPGWVE